ncbi:hypothetical protein LTR85_000456 [Meristemomyces frigidus]|nr:hypothetical protein LTR85_000456 [Meristemomyces frigidus]
MAIDLVFILRLAYLGAATLVLVVYLVPLLRDRLLAYGPRTASSTTLSAEREKAGREQPDSTPYIILLDRLAEITVPHSWFTSFYAVSVACSVVLQWTAKRDVSMTFRQVIVAWTMMTIQGSRRLYECLAFSKPSSSRMWFGHWLLGILFYAGMSVAVWVEGIPTLQNHSFSINDFSIAAPNFRSFVSILIFILASGFQYDCHAYLASLKPPSSQSKSSKSEETDYKLPEHPAFSGLIAPHYTAECLIYVSLALFAASQDAWLNWTLVSAMVFVVVNLGVTADGTKTWYEAKFGKKAVGRQARMIPLLEFCVFSDVNVRRSITAPNEIHAECRLTQGPCCGRSLLSGGFFGESLGQKGISRVSTSGIALAVCNAIIQPEKWRGKKVMVGSLHRYTGLEICRIWGKATGREVTVRACDEKGRKLFERDPQRRGRVSLSQYDALTIPETEWPSTGNSPTSSVADVSIPAYPSSQFWLRYNCGTPPPGSTCRFYYFKLSINGEAVVSWGVGEEDCWSGKTMFGLFDSASDFEGRKVIEKRGFFFSQRVGAGSGGGVPAIEIKVFRSKARRREKLGLEGLEGVAAAGGAVSILSVGRLKKGEPHRHYTYALIDPLDEPYCTFRYHLESPIRTGSPPASSRSSSRQERSDGGSNEHKEAGVERRLSVPPRMQLRPSTSRYEPSSPIKIVDSQSTNAVLSQQSPNNGNDTTATARNKWVVRTPSPVQADRDRLERAGTPPSSARGKNSSISLLRGVIANALKRRDESRSSDGAQGMGSTGQALG